MKESCESCLKTAASLIHCRVSGPCLRRRTGEGPAGAGRAPFAPVVANQLRRQPPHGARTARRAWWIETPLRFKDVWGKGACSLATRTSAAESCRTCGSDRGDVGLVRLPSLDAADYDVLRQSIGQYLSVFRERTPEREQAGPKLVFICAPLRGDVEANIEFAPAKGTGGVCGWRYPRLPTPAVPTHSGPKRPGAGYQGA